MVGRYGRFKLISDPEALQAKGLSAQDVENTIASANQILPPRGTVQR